MFTYQGKQRMVLFISGLVSASLFFALLVATGTAQQEVVGTSLLKEYFLPVQALAPLEQGSIVINGNECASAGSGDCVGHDVDAALGYGTDIDGVLGYRKTTDGLMMENNGQVSYRVTISEPAGYQLKLMAKNAVDSLSGVTRSQYETIKNSVSSASSGYAPADFTSFQKDFIRNDNPSIEGEMNREISFRQLRFVVTLQKDGAAQAFQLGGVRVADLNQFGTDALDLGPLDPGSYTITLEFINDLSLEYPGANVACGESEGSCTNFTACIESESGAALCGIPSADNGDGVLEKTPIIKELRLSKTGFTNDVLGVRVYSNPDHLSALDWYNQKLVRPGNPVPVEVDGYRGVLDGRTAYINAANINNKGVFYTNIYVIAYNVNASPATIQIFNQIVNNWQFNVNLSSGLNDLEKDRIKNQLRRDTARLEDINDIRFLLETYKLRNQRYPDLKSGTFVAGHVLSTWPTWQSVFATQLGAPLPADPINQLAIESYPLGGAIASEPRQYDCTSDAEKGYCETVCSRDEQNQPRTGCRANQQCVDDQYCSLIPPGFDPITGWNETNQTLAFTSGVSSGPHQFGQYPEGGFNTGGLLVDTEGPASKYKDDAFVYQYTAVNGGESYVLNYRLEYSAHCSLYDAAGSCLEFTSAQCNTNQCYFEGNDSCVESGQALFAQLKPVVAYDFNETSGTLLRDVTGGNHPAQLNSPIEQERSLREGSGASASQSIIFRGGDSMNSSTLNEGSLENFTVALVMKASSLPAAGAQAVLVGTSSQSILTLSTNTAGTLLNFTPNSSITLSSSADQPILNAVPYHIVATYRQDEDGTHTASIYLNGVKIAESNGLAGGSYAFDLLRFASQFSGSFDSFAFYDRVLNAREVYDLFQGNDAYIFDKYRNTYCFAGLFVNSCGNGIVQMDAGEQCEPSVQGTNSNFCDATYGEHPWYNKGSVNPSCTTSCETVGTADIGELPVPYNAQQPALSCGGYCGDRTVQFEAGELCDEGTEGGALTLPNRGGSGGVGPDSQYLCTASGISEQASISFFGTSQNLSLESANQGAVEISSPVIALPANTTYELTFQAQFSSSTEENALDVLLEELTKNGTLLTSHRKSFSSRKTNPEYSLTFTSRNATAQARISFTLSGGIRQAIISNVSAASVSGCRTFGGYCGDGSVQSLFSEQCDILSYRTPTPAQSVNQFFNPGFESGLINWSAVDTSGLPISALSAQNSAFSIERQERLNINTGKAALIFKPTSTIRGIAQQVFYAGSPAGTQHKISATLWAKRIVNSNAPTIRLRAYQYSPESGSLIPFSNGSDYLESAFTLPAGQDFDASYRKFTSGEIIIPAATASNTNAVTLLAIVAENTTAQTVVFFDDIEVSSNYRLEYSCGKKGSQSCQLIGGYCGDGAIQGNYGESCDAGPLNGATGLALNNNTVTVNGSQIQIRLLNNNSEYDANNDGAADGFVQSNKIYSYCTNQCSRPFCGDGVTGVIGTSLTKELCDPTDTSNPEAQYCENSCLQKKLGGSCSSDTDCTSGTACATDAGGAKKCVLLPGQRGCFQDSDCLSGLTCDPERNICLVDTQAYLKYHLNPSGFPRGFGAKDQTLAEEDQPVFTCPYTSIVSRLDTAVVLDGCTGLEFKTLDLPINTKVTHDQAVEACRTGGAGFALPAARELLALVSPLTYVDQREDGSSAKAPNNFLKLCSTNGLVTSKGGDDACLEGNASESYLYWTDTKYEGKKACSITNSVSCVQDSDCPLLQGTNTHESCNVDLYYAVDFKKGSLEVYPKNTLMRSRCVSSVSCGNGTIEGDEQCEFDPQGNEQLGGATCQEKGFAGGNAHCDPVSCRLRYDNCLAITKPGITGDGSDALTCSETCDAIGKQYFQIKQCQQADPNGKFHGCTANSDCAGICNQGACSNDPGLSCSSNDDCNFGSCVEAPVTANSFGLITATSGQEIFPSQQSGQENIAYSVNLSAQVTAQVSGQQFCTAIDESTGTLSKDWYPSGAVSRGICDLRIFPGNNSQVVANAASPATLCTCNIPNPTYFSNNVISVTNNTTQGILALDAFDNFRNANIITVGLGAVTATTPITEDLINRYLTAQAYTNVLPAGYPDVVINDQNQPQKLRDDLTQYRDNQAVYKTAQALQDSLNIFAAALVNKAVAISPNLAREEDASGFKRVILSVISNIKKLFGISASAADDPQTVVNQAMQVVQSLPPAAVSNFSRTGYKANPSLTSLAELNAFKLRLYSLLATAQARIDLKNADDAVKTLGATSEGIVTARDKRSAVEEYYATVSEIIARLNVQPTSFDYIEDRTVQASLVAQATGIRSVILNLKLVEDCAAPATQNYRWSNAGGTESQYLVSYDGDLWSEVPPTKYNTATVAYQCYYQCQPDYHEYNDGLCAPNACQGDLPVAQQQEFGSDAAIVQAGVNKGAEIITSGPALTWAYKEGFEANQLQACEWSCPDGSFKDPATNTCLSQCTNVCDPLKEVAVPEHATAIRTTCSSDAELVGCSDSSAVYDVQCDSGYKKVETVDENNRKVFSCELCPAGQVQDPNNPLQCVPACANVCGNLTAVTVPTNGGTAVDTQCSTTANAVCNNSVTTDFTCGGGYIKYEGTCVYPYTSGLTHNSLRVRADADSASALCREKETAFTTFTSGVVVAESSDCVDVAFYDAGGWLSGGSWDTETCGGWGSDNSYITSLYCY